MSKREVVDLFSNIIYPNHALLTKYYDCLKKYNGLKRQMESEKGEKNQRHTVTVRTTPPLAPSRAIARETAFTTNCCKKITSITNCEETNGIIKTTNMLNKKK